MKRRESSGERVDLDKESARKESLRKDSVEEKTTILKQERKDSLDPSLEVTLICKIIFGLFLGFIQNKV